MSVILLVAVTVILAATISVFVLDLGSEVQSDAPSADLTYELVQDGSEKTVAITLQAGDTVKTEQLYVTGSVPIDIGGAPTSSTPANDQYASRVEKFTESSGNNPPQVGIGETWDAGETIYVDPDGTIDRVSISIYWSSRSVEGINPGTPEGDRSYKLKQFLIETGR